MSCTRQTSLYTVQPLLGLPLNPSIFFRLRYPILFQLALLLFSPMQSYQLSMAGNLFSGIFFTLLSCHLNFITSLCVWIGYSPSSALITVLLVVLDHPSVF